MIPPGRPAIMGILNVTPDSFSDGGHFFDVGAAIDHGLKMVAEGADIIDVGGESTRPGSAPVEPEEEIRRVIPVVEGLLAKGVAVSLDTSKAQVAQAGLASGVQIINDVTALGDEKMASLCAEHGCTVCLMHMKGEPRTMQLDPTYRDVVSEVHEYLQSRVEYAVSQGIDRAKIWIDPGFGFGKTVEHNLELLRRLDSFMDMDLPVLIGVSRKSFLGKVLGDAPISDRLEATIAAQVIGQMKGAKVLRTHDVLAAKRAMTLTSLVIGSPPL